MLLKHWNKRFVTLLAIALLAPLVAIAGEAAFTSPAIAQVAAESSAPTAAVHKVHRVSITNRLTYEPPTIVVNVGDVVEWTNKDIYLHSVTAADHKSFDSGNIYPKRSWRYKAVKKGTYDYFCTPHPDMKGKLIVR
jgi:plastocyanin